MIRIFDIDNGHVVINENCLLIPELKTIVDTYENPVAVLSYVHFMTDPRSPYANLADDIKEETILHDYEDKYTPDDEPVYKAVEKMTKLYETPSMRLLKQAKIGLKTLGNYIEKSAISDGKDGNFATYQQALKSIATINREFKTLEKDVDDELRVRGGGEFGYDEI